MPNFIFSLTIFVSQKDFEMQYQTFGVDNEGIWDLNQAERPHASVNLALPELRALDTYVLNLLRQSLALWEIQKLLLMMLKMMLLEMTANSPPPIDQYFHR
jgi:hypothetical protein